MDKTETGSDLMNLWTCAGTLLKRGTDFVPAPVSQRILTVGFTFFVLITVSTYTANMAAFLTTKNLGDSVDSFEVRLSFSSSHLSPSHSLINNYSCHRHRLRNLPFDSWPFLLEVFTCLLNTHFFSFIFFRSLFSCLRFYLGIDVCLLNLMLQK